MRLLARLGAWRRAETIGRGKAPSSKTHVPCSVRDDACERCAGSGWMPRWRLVANELENAARELPGIEASMAEFLEAAGFIDQHGLDAWMRMYGRPDERFFELLGVFREERASVLAVIGE